MAYPSHARFSVYHRVLSDKCISVWLSVFESDQTNICDVMLDINNICAYCVHGFVIEYDKLSCGKNRTKTIINNLKNSGKLRDGGEGRREEKIVVRYIFLHAYIYECINIPVSYACMRCYKNSKHLFVRLPLSLYPCHPQRVEIICV